ncbi:FixH family protein [Halarcobacter sp.]|uniref:FixH family protein n=1 Tax=Halarcobacter sp. TaxID=2321133 RepID=UPI002AAA9B0B|nr:FixH family protein [Halarcobacter sp.]
MKLLKIVSILVFSCILLNAEPIDLKSKKDGYEVKLQSESSLVVGDNTFFVTLEKDGSSIKDAKVKAKFFMPEMPGMPYMEYIGKAKLIDGKYKLQINLSMSGTWQYHLLFKTADGKVHKIRSSVNL